MLTQEIKNRLDRLNVELLQLGSSNKEWTDHIKRSLIDLGLKRELSCYASGIEGAASGEWLYDLCWIRYEGDDIASLELAMESEWLNFKEAMDDFFKLVQSRSNLRLMVWQSTTDQTMKNELEQFKHQVKCFEKSEAGDSYLFSCWVRSNSEFNHSEYTYPSA